MSNDLINAVKRLERIGDETSATNAKLIDAATTLLATIKHRVDAIIGPTPDDVCPLPFEVASSHKLKRGDTYVGSPDYRYVPWPLTPTRDDSLRLGEAVADGLMQSIADWAEARTQAAISAANTMTRAVQE